MIRDHVCLSTENWNSNDWEINMREDEYVRVNIKKKNEDKLKFIEFYRTRRSFREEMEG